MNRNRRHRAATITLISFLCGCTVSPPEIVETWWQTAHHLDVAGGGTSERLNFFVHVSDPDGNDDIESVYLIHDSSEYYWRLQSDSWELIVIDEESWVGSTDIRMYRNEPLPRGAYRILVVDRAGEQAESSIYISSDRADPASTEYPIITVRDGEIVIESRYQRHTVRYYDGAGEVVKLLATTAKRIPVADVLTKAELDRAVTVAVAAYDDSLGIGVTSGEYDLP
jgi:hypothetical protein